MVPDLDVQMQKRRTILILLVLALLVGAGAWTADRFLKRRDHPGLFVFLHQWATNYPKSFTVDPPLLRIQVGTKEMDHLQEVVNKALERGVIMPEGDHYVDAEITAGDDHFRADLRIKGKMTDHVSGRKWSFRVIAKKGGGFRGMRRFSLQHPGTRNYLCDWFYHRLMSGEGLVALRYGFCKVELNGEDLGVYAYEEHFGEELVENNARVPGPVLRFDPALFWEHRLNGIRGVAVNDAYGAYQAAALDAYGTKGIAKDPEQHAIYEQALALVDAFRRGRLPASEVFDVDRTARRLALLDLVGGHHSMDWSDVKFYYDPVARRLEPVSYESFSAFPIRELAGAYAFQGGFRESDDLHRQLFNDPEIMRAYVHHLERYMRKEFLDSTFQVIGPDLDSAGAMLFGEFPYKPLDRSIYYGDQRAIRALLAAPAPLHVHLQRVHGDTVDLIAIPTDALPVQVDRIEWEGGASGPPIGRSLVPARQRGRVGIPYSLQMTCSGPISPDDLPKGGLRCHLLGSRRSVLVPISPFRLDSALAMGAIAPARGGPDLFPFVQVDEDAREVRILPGAWRIERDLVVPEGYVVKAFAPLHLTLARNVSITSRSPLEWIGTEDMPILVDADSAGSGGVHVIEAGRPSRLEHVRFMDLRSPGDAELPKGDVSFHRSPVHLAHVYFTGNGATLLYLTLSNATLEECRMVGGRDQLEALFCTLRSGGSGFTGAGDDALTIIGGEAVIDDSWISDCKGSGIKSEVHARVACSGVRITDAGTGLNTSDAGEVLMKGGSVQAKRVAHAGKAAMRYGPCLVVLEDVAADVEGHVEREAGSVLKVNGKEMGGSKALTGT